MSGAYSQNEIEVTPEMIEAGLNAYDAWYAASDNGPGNAIGCGSI
jgi:hypothetical protein